jgi:hypothetical protein
MDDALKAQPVNQPVDVAVVHDGAAAPEMDGDVPLVLSGHYHRREQHLLPDGTLSFWQGSTGASGLRGLEHEKPTPIRASVLYFDRDTRRLQAWDDITLGGLGLVTAKIERKILDQQFPQLAVPTESPSATTSATPTGTESPSPAAVTATTIAATGSPVPTRSASSGTPVSTPSATSTPTPTGSGP